MPHLKYHVTLPLKEKVTANVVLNSGMLRCIWVVSFSNVGTKAGDIKYNVSWFSSAPRGKCLDNVLK
jgi:hypothetical protein